MHFYACSATVEQNVEQNKDDLMKKITLAVLAASFIVAMAPAQASQEKRIPAEIYGADYRSAIYLVNNEKYNEAYPKILQLAQYGEKYPQFLLGMMLVSGQGTEADVAAGLNWMRLALEQKHPDWQRKYDEVISQFSAEQLAALEPAFEELKQKYGAAAQNIDCVYQKKNLNSNYRIHVCSKTAEVRGKYYTVVDHTE